MVVGFLLRIGRGGWGGGALGGGKAASGSSKITLRTE